MNETIIAVEAELLVYVCVRVCVCVCVLACVRACVRVRMRMRARACVCIYLAHISGEILCNTILKTTILSWRYKVWRKAEYPIT